jgi:hypothetical protein
VKERGEKYKLCFSPLFYVILSTLKVFPRKEKKSCMVGFSHLDEQQMKTGINVIAQVAYTYLSICYFKDNVER